MQSEWLTGVSAPSDGSLRSLPPCNLSKILRIAKRVHPSLRLSEILTKSTVHSLALQYCTGTEGHMSDRHTREEEAERSGDAGMLDASNTCCCNCKFSSTVLA